MRRGYQRATGGGLSVQPFRDSRIEEFADVGEHGEVLPFFRSGPFRIRKLGFEKSEICRDETEAVDEEKEACGLAGAIDVPDEVRAEGAGDLGLDTEFLAYFADEGLFGVLAGLDPAADTSPEAMSVADQKDLAVADGDTCDSEHDRVLAEVIGMARFERAFEVSVVQD